MMEKVLKERIGRGEGEGEEMEGKGGKILLIFIHSLLLFLLFFSLFTYVVFTIVFISISTCY